MMPVPTPPLPVGNGSSSNGRLEKAAVKKESRPELTAGESPAHSPKSSFTQQDDSSMFRMFRVSGYWVGKAAAVASAQVFQMHSPSSPVPATLCFPNVPVIIWIVFLF